MRTSPEFGENLSGKRGGKHRNVFSKWCLLMSGIQRSCGHKPLLLLQNELQISLRQPPSLLMWASYLSLNSAAKTSGLTDEHSNAGTVHTLTRDRASHVQGRKWRSPEQQVIQDNDKPEDRVMNYSFHDWKGQIKYWWYQYSESTI